jgi:hypothetical protein
MPRPKLPLKTEAEIEDAKEKLLRLRRSIGMSSELLQLQTAFFASIGDPLSKPVRKPASLRLALHRYASSLFDCEAKFYGQHVSDETELREWLEGLAASVAAEMVAELSAAPGGMNGFHCSVEEQQTTISEAVEERVEYWVAESRNRPIPTVPPPGAKGWKPPAAEPITPLSGRGSGSPLAPPQPIRETGTPLQNPQPPERSIGGQLEALRVECDLTQQKLSDELGMELRTVQRHLSGESRPSRRAVASYEKYFSKRLNTKVVISILS